MPRSRRCSTGSACSPAASRSRPPKRRRRRRRRGPRSPGPARRQVARRRGRAPTDDPIPAARDDPPVRARAPGDDRKERCRTTTSCRVLRRVPGPGDQPPSPVQTKRVLGAGNRSRDGEPPRRIRLGHRNRRCRHRLRLAVPLGEFGAPRPRYTIWRWIGQVLDMPEALRHPLRPTLAAWARRRNLRVRESGAATSAPNQSDGRRVRGIGAGPHVHRAPSARRASR